MIHIYSMFLKTHSNSAKLHKKKERGDGSDESTDNMMSISTENESRREGLVEVERL